MVSGNLSSAWLRILHVTVSTCTIWDPGREFAFTTQRINQTLAALTSFLLTTTTKAFLILYTRFIWVKLGLNLLSIHTYIFAFGAEPVFTKSFKFQITMDMTVDLCYFVSDFSHGAGDFCCPEPRNMRTFGSCWHDNWIIQTRRRNLAGVVRWFHIIIVNLYTI